MYFIGNGKEYCIHEIEEYEVLLVQLYSIFDIAPINIMLLNENGKVVQGENDIQGDYCFVLNKLNGENKFTETDCSGNVCMGNVRQPSFEGDICKHCASGEKVQNSQSLERKSQRVDGGITDIIIVAGTVDVEVPEGYEQIRMDLNQNGSGDYMYLCFQRGGGLPVVHVKVDAKQNPEYVLLNESCANEKVETLHDRGCFGYRKARYEQVKKYSGLAICDLKLSRNAKETYGNGWVQSEIPFGSENTGWLYLYYQLVPIGGFSCAKAEKSVVGLPKDIQLYGKYHERYEKWYLENQKLEYQHGMQKMTTILERNRKHVLMYESSHKQKCALQCIPKAILEERANKNRDLPYAESFLYELVKWFKHEFFKWMDKPDCDYCGMKNTTQSVGSGLPTPEEQKYLGGRVELYQCNFCQNKTRFVRYNDPEKLLQTRVGRCGEWANCFTLCCRALGYKTRYVYDFTDHVWSEVYSYHYKRWIHCDPCEAKMDCPLIYEQGWGKTLTYIFAFSKSNVADVTRRYSRKFTSGQILCHRTEVSELWLETIISQVCSSQLMASGENVKECNLIQENEHVEFKQGISNPIFPNQTVSGGRVSGSAEWKGSRQEDGMKTSNAPTLNHGPSTTDLIKVIFNQLVQGCGFKQCRRLYCAQRNGTKENDPANAVAHALKEVAKMGAFSQRRLLSLICPGPTSIERSILLENPVLYFPLQDLLNCTQLASALCDGGLINDDDHEHVIMGVQRPVRLVQTSKWCPTYMVELGSCQLSFKESIDLAFPFSVTLLLSVAKAIAKACVVLTLEVLDSKLELKIDENLHLVVSIVSDQAASCVVSETKLMCNSVVLVGLRVRNLINLDLDIILNGKILETSKEDCTAAKVNVCSTSSQLKIGSPLNVACGICVGHLAIYNKEVDLQTIAEMEKQSICPPKLLRSTTFGGNVQTTKPRSCVCSKTQHAAEDTINYRVSCIKVWSSTFLQGIQFIYTSIDGDIVEGSKLIGNSVKDSEDASGYKLLSLKHGEYISRITGRSGFWMDGITLHLNTGINHSFGGSGGGIFTINIPQDHEVRMMDVQYGDSLDNIRVYSGKRNMTK